MRFVFEEMLLYKEVKRVRCLLVLQSQQENGLFQMILLVIYGAFILTEIDGKWLLSDCVKVFILHRYTDAVGFIGLGLS